MDSLQRLGQTYEKLASSSQKIRNFVNGIFDDDSFVEWDACLAGKNFIDGSDALGEGVLTGYATLDGIPVYLFAHNFEVMKGSFSAAQAKKITKAMENAVKANVPFVSIIDSSGARIGEGVGILEGYGRLFGYAAELSSAVPHIAIVKGQCVGLMSAYLKTADIVIASEKDALCSLVSPAVLTACGNLTAPVQDTFGAEAMKKRGNCSLTYSNVGDLKNKLSKILYYLDTATESEDDLNRILNLSEASTAEQILSELCDEGEYLLLHAQYAPQVQTAFGKVGGRSVAFLSVTGELSKAAIEKSADFLLSAVKFSMPLVTLVNSNGISHSVEDEFAGISTSVAHLLSLISVADVPKIAVITGTATGFAYLAFAGKELGFDYSLAFAGAEISTINTPAAVEILYAEDIKAASNPDEAREKLLKKYQDELSNPFVAAKEGYIDNVIEPSALRAYIASLLQMRG